MNGPRIHRDRCCWHRVITASQLQIRLAVLCTPNGLLRMRMCSLRWNVVSTVAARIPSVVSAGLTSILRGCSRTVLLRVRFGIVAGLAVARRGGRHIEVVGSIAGRCAWISHGRVAGNNTFFFVEIVFEVFVILVKLVGMHKRCGQCRSCPTKV